MIRKKVGKEITILVLKSCIKFLWLIVKNSKIDNATKKINVQ